ncbi:alpha/beta hydrolase [Devosia sp. A16]|uniref:alpha/beta hydrolase n=1 Tax=Devosia sp. A16 TaxID=1736675 RepID=UPI0006D7D7F2|nr:alpha/beta hydrolase [Devosia sp. A16]
MSAPDHRAPRYGWWAAWAGLAFAVAALLSVPLSGVKINHLFASPRGSVSWLTLFLGVALTGALFWWLLLGRAHRFTLPRGALAGVLVAFFSYPVVLTLTDLLRHGSLDPETYASRGSNILLRTILTQLTTGFASTLALAMVGMALVLALHRRHPGTVIQRSRPGLCRTVPKLAAGLALGLVALLLGAFTVLALLPLDTAGLGSNAAQDNPALSYDDAVARIEAVRGEEAGLPLNPRCRSTLLTHGRKVARVVVFFHGLTNCPAQAEQLAAKLFGLGYNVYLPRIPQHGDADQMSLALADLTAETMIAVGNAATDIAQGLGDEVVVTGLSAGGIIAGWIGQHRADADQSIAIAPFLSPNLIPDWANHAATALLLNAPNAMAWWDPATRDNPPGMTYAYPRYATHGLAQVLRLSIALMDDAAARAPLSPRLGLLINEADDAVSKTKIEELALHWQQHGADLEVVRLPLALELGHDLIDPHQPTGDPDFVYQVLVDMMNGVPPKLPEAAGG